MAICLFTTYRAVSTLCCGSEALHTELRVRITCEMALNADFYLQPSIICLLDVPEGGKQTPVLPASSSKFDEACRHITATERKNIARITLQLECESTPKNGSWSSMWHVHAISSVLKRPVFSVYPKMNERTRSVFHRNVFPRLEVLSQKSDVM